MVDVEKIVNCFKEIIIAIGDDPEREGLKETPLRVAKMYEELFDGLHKDPREDIKIFEEGCHEELVIVKDIPLYSVCEHHFIPFIGKASVAYIPSEGKVLGLSKIARIVDTFAKKPQIQERLCSEIADFLVDNINPKGVAVVIEAEHLCITMRGVKKPGSITITSALRGIIKDNMKTREEVFFLIKS